LQPYNNYIELVYCFIEIDKNLEEFTMEVFKTLDIRGLSFFKAYQLASEEFKRIKKNGILELIVDKQKNFTEDFSKWAKSQGGKIFDIEDDHRMVRLFIRKGSRVAKV
jgi:TusA-related sulfurtransferase